MIVLVTGGAGYIGSHACKALAQAGHRPVVFDNLSAGHREAVRWGPLIVGDLADAVALKRAFADSRAEAVMHFAASAFVGESVVHPRRYYANNLVNSLTLLDVMLDGGVSALVFSSSCATFGLQNVPLLDEQQPQDPTNPYGETKRAIERAIHWYGNAYGLRSVTLRYFNAAGADPDGELGEDHDPEPHLIPNVLRAAAGRLSHVDIFGDDYPTPDGTAVRDYVHVTDLAAAHVSALEYLVQGGQPVSLNLGSGRGYSVREVIDAARLVTGVDIPTRNSPRRPGDPSRLVADGTAARRLLQWQVNHSDMNSILKTAWSWERRTKPAPSS